MEWVETTGKTVEEAKDAALDQLGVDEQDAEFEVVEEPRTGLFGRTRGEARVRARVRPTQPGPRSSDVSARRPGRAGTGVARRGGGGGGDKRRRDERPIPAAPACGDAAVRQQHRATRRPSRWRQGRPRPSAPADRPPRSRGGGPATGPIADDDDEQETMDMSDTELAEQGEVVRGFLVDLLDAFGLDGEVTATPAEEGAVELAVTGRGPRAADRAEGRHAPGGPGAVPQRAAAPAARRVARPDPRRRVSGYRARRSEALERFVRQVAEDVLATGTQKALEPMSPPDRKVVHDTVNEIDGVHTVSEGEDARRRVVILPDA